MIRRAAEADIWRIVEMCRTFFEGSTLADHSDWDTVSVTLALKRYIDEPGAELLVAEVDGQVVGMVCGVVFPAWYNQRHLMGQELFWWVDPEHRKGDLGRTLLEMIEHWAKAMGAKTFLMSTNEYQRPEAVARLLARRGYSRFDNTFWRTL